MRRPGCDKRTTQLVVAFVLFAQAVAWAGQRIAHSAVNVGGAECESAHFEVESNLGGWGDVAESGPGTWIKPDFVGTLYDPVSVEVSAPSTNLSESQSVQLSARFLCDDDSIVDCGGDESWTIESGPLNSSGGGWVTAQPVYRNSNAMARASCHGLSGRCMLTVRDVNPDDYGLYAGDNIADGWQVNYFGEASPDGAANADYDGDGADNYFEFTSGTDPRSPSHFFHWQQIRRAGAVQLGLGPVDTNRVYHIERSSRIAGGMWLPVTNITMAAPAASYAVLDGEAGTNAFYRVAVHYDWRNIP